MIPRNARTPNNRVSLILANRKYPGKPPTMVSASLLDGKKRGNLIFTGNGIRIRTMKNAVPNI